jgi:hypothetical protein
MEAMCQDEAAELRELEQAVAQLQSLKRHVQVASCAAACACSRACWPLARVAAGGNADADAERGKQTDLCSQLMIEIMTSIVDDLCFDVCADIHRSHLMRMLLLHDLPGQPVPSLWAQAPSALADRCCNPAPMLPLPYYAFSFRGAACTQGPMAYARRMACDAPWLLISRPTMALHHTPESASFRAGQLSTNLPPRDAQRDEAVRDAHTKARVCQQDMLLLVDIPMPPCLHVRTPDHACSSPPNSSSCLLLPPPLFL